MFASESEIESLALGMINCTLPKARWTHAAHFASALWLLRNPDHNPFKEMPDMIRRYNESVGGVNTDREGYHETITQASLCAAQNCLTGAPIDAKLPGVLDDLMRSKFGQTKWLLEYWTEDVLFSPAARRAWVDPDIQSLPF
ncbi:MAG: hypothetical protein HKN36_09075 [Hellea sp.]|nr:hypothetical protein [Hellea sp.]